MALTTNFNFNPYYDDYDENKKFLRILFKPGYSVQARELTQLQTLLQKQIERFGKNIFVNGVAVLDGKSSFQNCISLKLQDNYANFPIDTTNFSGKILYNNNNTKRAQIIVAIPRDVSFNEPPTLMIQQLFGDPFSPGEVVKTNDSTPIYASIIDSDNAITKGQTFSIESGIFFFDGFFVKTDAQSIAISKYNTNSATLKVGFEIREYFVSATDDATLVDPAQEATNYQAPGADRYKIEMVLVTRSLDSEDLENFIELAQFNSGVYQSTRKLNVYNKIADEMARRTYDESGNYIVSPFPISAEANTNNPSFFDISIGPGKAYILGYEISMDYPRTLTIPKARTIINVENRVINSTYGNYLLTDNHSNCFNINAMTTVDLHCVHRANINSTDATTYAFTKIGTANIKSEDYFSASNSSIGSSYIYATSLFDVNTSNIAGTTPSVIDNKSFILETTKSSTVDDAYTGAFIRFTTGPASIESSKLIVDYDGVTRKVTVNPPFSNPPVALNNYTIEFNVQDIESLVQISSGTTINASADVSLTAGIDPATLDITNKANLVDSKMEEPIFNLGANFIKESSLNNITYVYQKRYTATIATTTAIINADTGESFVVAQTNAAKALNYKVVCLAAASIYSTGQVIPSSAITLSGDGSSQLTIKVSDGAGGFVSSMQIGIIASISRTASQDNKIYRKANSSFYNNSTEVTERFTFGGLFYWLSNGQIQIPAGQIQRNPKKSQSLYLIDCIKLVKVLDFEGKAASTANFSGAKDITSSFVLDNGQRDSYYDHSSIKLKPGAPRPIGPLVLYVDKFEHPDNRSGYFSVNSYNSNNFPYDQISGYLSSSGKYHELRDCLDFRPSMKERVTTRTLNINSDGPKLIKRNSQVNVTFERYLPRIDKIQLSAEGNYSLTQGVPSDFPIAPPDLNRSLTLYEISIPPYTADLKEIEFKARNSRRYTMKDIGNIDQRLKNIEYYTALSLLENEAASKSDVSLFDRSKNGIITDSFVGFDVTDLTTGDYTASIDTDRKELRPSPIIYSFPLTFDRANSSNFRSAEGNPTNPGSNLFYLQGPDTGGEAILAEQPFATRAISVNPYNVQSFVGSLRLKPQSDIWIDVNRLPDVVIQDPANAGMINFINSSRTWAQIEWGSWNRVSLGRNPRSTWQQTVSLGGRTFRNDTWQQIEWRDNQTRTGTLTYFVPQEVRTSLGTSVVSSSIIPWMRKKEIIYTVTGMKPFATLYPFFDGLKSIKKYISSHNYFTINTAYSPIFTSVQQMAGPGAIQSNYYPFDVYQFNVPNSGRVYIKNGSNIVGNATVTLISGDRMYVDDVTLSVSGVNWPSGSIFLQKPTFNELNPNTPLAGIQVGANVNLVTDSSKAYVYRTGKQNGVTTEDNRTSIALSTDAANANIIFVAGSTPIRVILEDEKDYTPITQQADEAPSEWPNREGTVTAIATASGTGYKTVTVNPAIRTNVSSVIQIGELKIDGSGGLAGSFYCPRGKYRTGEKILRLTDNPLGNFGESSARADSRFFAQGKLDTVEERILSTIRPLRTVENFSEDRTLVSFNNERIATGAPWRRDPLAETFLVEPTQHPDGIFLSKVRVCFKSRDETIPVMLQIRPSVNGYPSATDVYPFAEVSLTPESVKITDYPNFTDSSRYTDFVFEAPVHLSAGEHAVVLLSNSNLYEAWIATKDQKDVNTNAKVSNQPFTGSFFKSQNGQTWTAEQESDLMFRIYYYQFSDESTATISLELDADELPTSNVNYDLLILQTQEVAFSNTSISYSLDSTQRSTGIKTGELNILPNEDILMLDKYGARVVDPSKGPSTLQIKASLTTRNKDISPVLDLDRFGVILLEQVINNLPISNADVVVSNTGSYTSLTGLAVSINGGGGNGATAIANTITVDGTSTIDKIIITNGGQGYKTSPNISITGGTATFDAVANVIGEDKQLGGNSVARHLVKRVTLADGFSSGDLRVYLTAHKPSRSSIDVYYKLLAGGDLETWREKEWQLMTQIENVSYVSEKIDDFAELVFAPGANNKPDNIVSYVSDTSGEFHEFNSFAIKIVLSGVNTVDIPRVRDFRAMALPAG